MKNNDREWTLTVVRDGRQGIVKNADDAKFKFGRWRKELDKSNISYIPNGLITLLRDLGLEEDALESGFLVRMSKKCKKGDKWTPFNKVASVDSSEAPVTRVIYAGPMSLCTLEVELWNNWGFDDKIPKTLWVTLEELPEPILAWIFGKGMLLNYEGKQSTLHEWCDFPVEMVIQKSPTFALPGPPPFKYHFFGDGQ